MLSLNALCILDQLGVYGRIRPEGYEFDKLYFRSLDDQPMDTYNFRGTEKYGYNRMRIYRHVLIQELSAMVSKAKIPIKYYKKFIRVVAKIEEDITFKFIDGTTETATCLVSVDGIHSRVHKYLYPDLKPIFTNIITVTAAVLTSQLQVPSGYILPVTMLNRMHGAFVITPPLADGSEVLIRRQKQAQQLSQEGWDELLNKIE